MITARVQEFAGGGGTYKVDGVVNKGGWFGKSWLIGIGCGLTTFYYVVEADHENHALDLFVDSKHGHLLKIDEAEVEEKAKEYQALLAEGREEEFIDFENRAGNCGDPIDLTDLQLLHRCDVNYFAPRTDRCVNHDPDVSAVLAAIDRVCQRR